MKHFLELPLDAEPGNTIYIAAEDIAVIRPDGEHFSIVTVAGFPTTITVRKSAADLVKMLGDAHTGGSGFHLNDIPPIPSGSDQPKD